MNFPFEVHFGKKQSKYVEISQIALLFFDTVHAELKREFGEFSYFKYCDEEGDYICVQTDDDLSSFLATLDYSVPNKVWLVYREENEKKIPQIIPSDLINIGRLSCGQFGTVYKSLHVPSDRLVAVKSIEICEGSEEKNNVLREVSVLQKCMPSDFIVEFLGALIDINTLSICLEYMDLGSIENYLPVITEVHRHVSKCVFRGLYHLWSNNIMHRDLKPSNILVSSCGFVKISDFGVSKHVEHSVARTFVGTKAYMAPERFHGGIYIIESDIWSFGVTAWEMANGYFPFKNITSLTLPELSRDFLNAEVNELQKNSDLESSLINMIINCVCYSVDNRWNCAQLKICDYLHNIAHIDRDLLKAHFSKYLCNE